MGRSVLVGALLLAVWSLGLLACIAFAWHEVAVWRLLVAAGACAASGAVVGWWWWRQPAGLLAWDTAAWSWSEGDPDVRTGAVQVVLDLQSILLLRWRAPGQARWLWAERARLPAHWDALRRAVYSRANPEAPPRAEPPSATP